MRIALQFRRLLQLVHHHAGARHRPQRNGARGRSYETLLGLHILSVDVLLVWFPFGKLMHAFYIFPSRAINGAVLARKGAAS